MLGVREVIEDRASARALPRLDTKPRVPVTLEVLGPWPPKHRVQRGARDPGVWGCLTDRSPRDGHIGLEEAIVTGEREVRIALAKGPQHRLAFTPIEPEQRFLHREQRTRLERVLLEQDQHPTRASRLKHRLEEARDTSTARAICGDALTIDERADGDDRIERLIHMEVLERGLLELGDALEGAVARALERTRDRSLQRVAEFEQTSLEDFHVDEPFDAVVAIGALVDGEGVATDRARRRRISRFFEAMLQTRSPRGVLILLEQDALEARPLLAMEEALFGLYRREREPMLGAFGERYPDLSFSCHDGFLKTDVAIAWRPVGEATPDARVTSTALDAVLRGPWAEDLERHWHAWLCVEAGQGARARAILDDLPDSEHVRLLRARLDA